MKINILYAPNNIMSEIQERIEHVKTNLMDTYNINITKSISICFYISEKAFIQNLCKYFQKSIAESMRAESSGIKEMPKLYTRR